MENCAQQPWPALRSTANATAQCTHFPQAQQVACKRARDSMDCDDDMHSNNATYSPADIAVCLGKRLLPDSLLRKVVVPQLKAAQRTQGLVQTSLLASLLASVMGDGTGGPELCYLLCMASVEDILLSPSIHYGGGVDKAGILCAALAVDPWCAFRRPLHWGRDRA